MKSFAERMIGAATLDVPTYEEVEHDESATGQAAGVVVIVAVCGAIGALGQGGGGIVSRSVGALLMWAIWSGVTFFIGTRLFAGTATWGELLRTIGFAQSPGVLFILGAVPLIGGLAGAVGSIWVLIAGIIAIRQALDFDTGKALLTAFLGWLAGMAAMFALALVIGVPFAVLGSLAN
ncbi:MAG: YIP1 family protein [Gemmatimonadetes bacterium]|nr:YIP1 family protein [Gemmatimonadota bacterium]